MNFNFNFNFFKNWREPMNALTHLIALIFFLPFLIFLVLSGFNKGGYEYAVPLFVFSLSVVLVYISSTVYHLINASQKTILFFKKLDHSMIFILIAGTYTPICLINLYSSSGIKLLCIVWGIALVGIITKLLWINAPRWLSTLFYILMGWSALSSLSDIYKNIPIEGIFLLLLGGVIYSIGAIIYILKKPDLNLKYFGFHEIFHIFVIGGTTCYIIYMFRYILN